MGAETPPVLADSCGTVPPGAEKKVALLAVSLYLESSVDCLEHSALELLGIPLFKSHAWCLSATYQPQWCEPLVSASVIKGLFHLFSGCSNLILEVENPLYLHSLFSGAEHYLTL